ncbi:MAG TPA: histidine ammonia-lyase [Planctomycetota bacterium]|jgi:histidine ammonia-lyase|nr:histidine ammonia-lyase [Planctomycetota bacterium]
MDRLTLAHLPADLDRRVASLAFDDAAVRESRRIVDSALQDGAAYYGINTGFGILANQRVETSQLAELQRRLLLSHSVGVGQPLGKELTRLMLGLKIHALALGYSGVSLPVFRRLVLHYQRDLIPVVPGKGSLGASGDLAPLSHLCLPLLGLGDIWDSQGNRWRPTSDVLREHDLAGVDLLPKDGLALINGTQFMLAHGALVLHQAQTLKRVADVLGIMTLESMQGSARPFDARIHEARPHPGQRMVAANGRRLLLGSAILASHKNCGQVQDPYSLRCIPQVHGAARDALRYAEETVLIELHSVTDNPLVFPGGDILSGGNFHGEPLALCLDTAALALSELASISERRIYLLLEGHRGLPRLLIRETGINSGFMIPQYTAAALVSENKVLCHPASVDSIPSCLGQEDHVSMGSIAATKLLTILHNVIDVLAIELLCASQALDYRLPSHPGAGLLAAHRAFRSHVPHREIDHSFQEDLHVARSWVRDGHLLKAVEEVIGPLDEPLAPI